MPEILADLILILHVFFVIFVIGGFMLIVAGYFLKWGWVHDIRFRIIHLAAIGLVTLQTLLSRLCPLTIWESSLRRAAGGSGYSETFAQHWLSHLLYYDLPAWVFQLVYGLFLLLVVIAWFVVRPDRTKKHS